MVFKIDLQKAYNSLDWGFLEWVLGKFGFPSKLVNLILFCIKNNSISILWNRKKLPTISPKRGLRQGDPLAPYMFNLARE